VTPTANARLISLFGYANSSLASWLEILSASRHPTHLLVPVGNIIGDLRAWLGVGELEAGEVHRRGALTVQVLPFVSQDDYDRLLWSCDFNAVRGEDSFLRAQWAGRPMLWQPYVQPGDAQLDKLEAFLALYGKALTPRANSALVALWRSWNTGKDMQAGWQALLEVWPEMTAHAENWCRQQAGQTNISAALVQFYRKWV